MATAIFQSTNCETVSSVALSASASAIATPCRVRGVVVRSGASAGTLVLKDGGISGTTLITIPTPASVGLVAIPVPGAGVKFGTDCYAILTNATAATLFYS